MPIQSIKGEKGDQGFVSTDLKRAMLQMAKQIPCIDGRGQRYYQDLWNALFGDDYIANFTSVGDPQIENGILTSSSGGWIETPESFNPGSNPWELTVKLKRPSIPGAEEVFLQGNGIRLRSNWQSANAALYLYSDSGTIVSGSDQKSVPAGEWRWLKVVFAGDATGYDYGVSTDGVTFTYISGNTVPFKDYRGSAYKTATPVKAGSIAIGSSNSIAKFDLRETEIKINGQTWWKPYIF